MKLKIATIISALVMLLLIVLPCKVSAITSSGGYTIESYDINMIVNEDNTFYITETIDVDFTGYNKHGIFRKIPLKNKVERLDGTKSTNRAKISDISVDDKFTTSNEDGYKVIKIGSSDKTVTGKKTYTIKYTYNIGKDPLKDADELYFNLIGNEWDANIDNVTFKITMPKEFDKTKLGFSSGNKTSTDSSKVTYDVKGNIISGNIKSGLFSGQALTVRLTLPEGYFVGASNNFDYIMLIKIAISILFVFIAYFIWNKYGKDEIVVDTVEFYPPEGLNSAELGFIYKGNSERQDVISLLIELANKGYIKIEEYGEKTLKMFKSNNFKIIKVKEYDGDNEDEKTFFNGLFKRSKLRKTTKVITENDLNESKEEVTKSDLYNSFYTTLDKITKNINRKENQEKVFEKASLGKRGIIIAMIAVIFILMGGLSIFKLGNIQMIIMIFVCLIGPLALLYKKPNVGTVILGSLAFVIAGFACMYSSTGVIDSSFIVQFIVQGSCLIMLIVFLAIMKKRTEYGKEMLGRIKGFKNFLEVAEKPKLEELVMEDPEYFYKILPYTYVLGVSNKWMKKFEDIALEAPTWYYGYSYFSIYTFNSFMNSTYSTISNAMTSSPSSSGGSGGGFSGGGFSGGGSGGGGGGSW